MTSFINASTSSGVVTTADTSGSLALQTASTTALTLDTSQNATFAGSVKTNTLTSAASTALTLQSAGTTAVTINTSQQVGIGTASPNEKLVVNGAIRSTNNAVSATATPDSGVFYFVPTADAPSDPRTMLQGVGTASVGASIAFLTGTSASNSERMRIDSSGNLLVGTTSNVTSAKINIAAGSSDGVMYQIAQFTGGSGTGGNEVGEMKRQTTASVANSATTIESSLTFGELVTVTGVGAGAIFADLLMASYNTVSVISSNTQQGSPASRTYSISGGALKLTMGSATAMYITIQSLISGAKGA